MGSIKCSWNDSSTASQVKLKCIAECAQRELDGSLHFQVESIFFDNFHQPISFHANGLFAISQETMLQVRWAWQIRSMLYQIELNPRCTFYVLAH